MGNCCSCCQNENKDDLDPGSSERSPLLGAENKTGNGAVTNQPRRSNSQSSFSSIGKVKPIAELEEIVIEGCQIDEVDRKLRDGAELFNQYLSQLIQLREIRNTLIQFDPGSSKSLSGSFKHVADITDTPISVELKSWEPPVLTYDKTKVCAEVQAVLDKVDTCSGLLRNILESRGERIIQTANILVNSKKEFEKEVLVASQGAEGPLCMANCKTALRIIHTIPERVEMVVQESDDILKELRKAAKQLRTDPLEAANIEKQSPKHRIEVTDSPVAPTTIAQATSEQACVQQWLNADKATIDGVDGKTEETLQKTSPEDIAQVHASPPQTTTSEDIIPQAVEEKETEVSSNKSSEQKESDLSDIKSTGENEDEDQKASTEEDTAKPDEKTTDEEINMDDTEEKIEEESKEEIKEDNKEDREKDTGEESKEEVHEVSKPEESLNSDGEDTKAESLKEESKVEETKDEISKEESEVEETKDEISKEESDTEKTNDEELKEEVDSQPEESSNEETDKKADDTEDIHDHSSSDKEELDEAASSQIQHETQDENQDETQEGNPEESNNNADKIEKDESAEPREMKADTKAKGKTKTSRKKKKH